MSTSRTKNVCVVVLGDIGRSPRMQYHSLSLANSGYNVNVIGYKETKISNSLSQHSNIHIHPLKPCPTIHVTKFLNYIIKTIWQTITLLFALLFKRADYVLVQNPPAVPTLITCWFYCFLIRAKFIIDWHNYAHTIMALSVGHNHILVKITKFMEAQFGRYANVNFCVTNAMKNDLKNQWNINASTLYDRPPDIFHSISIKDKHDLFIRLGIFYSEFKDTELTKTSFTEINSDGIIKLREDRPALLISSTSWTEDEDFSILLSALQNYEQSYENDNEHNLPKLICVITGKGPLKDYYIKLIEKQKMQHVTIITPWLETNDYPLLLAAADLGVCLHISSSGLDLPMKVVDMFGCELPVCAFDFKCLNELVRHEENSYIFKNSLELTSQLINWFTNFPNNKSIQKTNIKFKDELHKFQKLRWDKNWELNAKPLFN